MDKTLQRLLSVAASRKATSTNSCPPTNSRCALLLLENLGFAGPNGDGASSWRASREREWLASPDYVIEKEVNFYRTRVRVIAE